MINHKMKRVVRDLQSYFPFIRHFKFRSYNLSTKYLGLRVEPEFKLLSNFSNIKQAIDIGGNWGQSIYALKRHARPSEIICFEPNPILIGNLQNIAQRLGGVRVENVGLGDESGTFTLHVPRYRKYIYDGLASIDHKCALEWLNNDRLWRFDQNKLSIEQYVIDLKTLDSFNFSPDVVKIDVQGMEEAVVRGGMNTFSKFKPATIVEAPTPGLINLLQEASMKPYGLRNGKLILGEIGGTNTIFLSECRYKSIKI